MPGTANGVGLHSVRPLYLAFSGSIRRVLTEEIQVIAVELNKDL